jgi:5-methylcytosine-specific restriction endonuclease McrBC regulatory subunit McrC
VIGPRDAPWLIVDAKYKNPLRETWGKEYFHNEDLYQAFTYATALGAPAVLVYPRVDQDVDVMLESGEREVRIATVDLMASSINMEFLLSSSTRRLMGSCQR